MPPLQGFSDNAFLTKDDLATASESLLRPLLPYFSEAQARVRIPITSGAHFDEAAAQLEGYARPLWVVAALLSDSSLATKGALSGGESRASPLQPWINGLRHGIDPSHSEYWGPIGDWDQRMVEAEIISFALLTAPEAFYDPLTAGSKEHLVSWLRGLNGKVMPVNNWRWFRVLSNLALIKVCSVQRESVWKYMEEDLETLETFYMSNGWSSDGVWRPVPPREEEEGGGADAARGRHADYYSGSFAIQFSQMLYSKFADDLDPARAGLFRDRARQFIRQFWAYFDKDGWSTEPTITSISAPFLTPTLIGAAIPFGRSLAYRFAMGAFYAAFAYVGLCDDSEDLLSHGAVKGMLLRHLRWWANRSDNAFWPDGTFSIGYLYPNMYMSEDYNSPQSPYWALKSLIVVALPADHPFWRADELPHPLSHQSHDSLPEKQGVTLVRPARQILCDHPKGQHHFLLSSGQFCVWPMKATQAKYAKFAYSSAFGFSVPTGTLITQIAPDSTLALSHDDGESWAVRWKSIGETQFVDLEVCGGTSAPRKLTALVSRWRPWGNRAIEVETTLIPPCDQWPDWHVRVHRIRTGVSQVGDSISFVTVEGGFAIDGCRKSDGRTLLNSKVEAQPGSSFSSSGIQNEEGALETPSSSFVTSTAGASGIVDLSPRLDSGPLDASGEILKVDPNTNLMAPRTLLPTIKRNLTSRPRPEVVIATGVFAISFDGQTRELADIESRWAAIPKITWSPGARFTLS